ncbi:hypothetical protein [Nocardia terpenica]|uniref:Uncharacterized protein n=1 Tax=Nocardia terpenica TaxID=455432 RepID=A0A6G9Z0P1_9NOCA|nr:hypothetical protein [Nocardia terpenica]QIS18937.1 hypothetical protein F6W96_12145 [Nocardia terpenica]
MPYPTPTWVAPLWWAPPPKRPAISRPTLVAAWIERAAEPKPPRKEFGDEMMGWSGVLGSTKPWVALAYTKLAAFLARVNIIVDEPEGWLAVSHLYADHVDALARFSAQYAAVAHKQRPRGLPNKLGDKVKCYALTVPPAVRAAMVSAPGPGDTGGVVDTERSARTFTSDPERHYETYHRVAMTHYVSTLRSKSTVFQDDPEITRSFAEQITALADFDDQSPSPWSADERRVNDRLSAQVDADAELRTGPHLSAAYLRAYGTMLRWASRGRPLHNATILYTQLRSARLDEQKAERARAAHETLVSADELTSFVGGSRPAREFLRVEDSDILSRAATILAHYPAFLPGTRVDCWEKTVALALLGGAPRAQTTGELRTAVEHAWQERTAADRAMSATPKAAAKLVEALLFLAVSQSTQIGDLGENRDGATDRIARRQVDTDAILHSHGLAIDDLEDRS